MKAPKALVTNENSNAALRAAAVVDDLRPVTGRRDSVEIARYIADMSAEMAAMAGAGKLDILAYFLSMARVEAEIISRNGLD